VTRKRLLLLGALLAVAGIGAPTTTILISDRGDATDPPPAPPRVATEPAEPARRPVVGGTPAPVSAAPVTEVVTTSPALSTPARPATTLRPPEPVPIRKPVVRDSPPPLSSGPPDEPVVQPPPPLTGDDDEPPG